MREEGEVDVLGAAEDLAPARRVDYLAGQRILRQAVDVQRGAPVPRTAALAVELLHPARRVELQLHEGGARMLGQRGGDIGVAVRSAGTDLLRIGLRVAHRHAEPERRGELEA